MATAAPDVGVCEEQGEGGEIDALRAHIEELEQRVHRGEQRRRAMVHIMDDLARTNRRLSDQRRAMLHILSDYEQDRKRLAAQAVRLDNSRRALLHILQDSHRSNLKLENSRKAMIHIMGDLAETSAEVRAREQDLRDKQEQLVQAGKLATLGELTTGVAHELNNPLNNIALFVGNAIDQIDLGVADAEQLLVDLRKASEQVLKATQIISHLRTFGRAAVISAEPVSINSVARDALSLMHEQLRLRQIEVALQLSDDDPKVLGSAIQLEQVFINLLSNARDALAESAEKRVTVQTTVEDGVVNVTLEDTGPGIPEGYEQRIFDPFLPRRKSAKARA